ncbi:MAG: creatininase family protein [Methanomassiliicoccales archaeon]|nr:creatininase family protein [Methanomassiliicoccales archaeon]
MRIDEMSSTAFAQAVRADPIVFLPIGAIEAHGPHLPLGTDTFQPEFVVNAVSERLEGLVAPTINYGQHSSTRNFPGTIDISFDTLRSLVLDVLAALQRNGVRKVVVVSGHLGSVHRAAIKLACESSARQGLKVMMLSDYELAYLKKADVCEGLPDGHGGIVETSRMIDIRPDLVSADRTAGVFVDSHFMIHPDPERCLPQGFGGDARLASKEKGRLVNEYVIDTLIELVRKNFEG